jgi:hypothetical protein
MCDGFLNKKKIRVVAPTAHTTTLKETSERSQIYEKKIVDQSAKGV